MKARVFPKLDVPEDLYEIDKFIAHYDTVQEQIEFLKYVKMEMELYYEARIEDEFDAADLNQCDYWNKILDKKIKFYEDIFYNGEIKESRTNSESIKEIKSLNDRINEIVDSSEKTEVLQDFIGTTICNGLARISIEEEDVKLQRKQKLDGGKDFIFFNHYDQIEEQLGQFEAINERLNYLAWIKQEAVELLIDLKNITMVDYPNIVLYSTANKNVEQYLKFVNENRNFLISSNQQILSQIKELMLDFEKEIKNILLPKVENKLEYYKNTKLENDNTKQNLVVRKKIKISNEIIAEEVTKHWDNGLEEFEEIYEKISERSTELFGVKLTKNQVKGRYQRYAEKNKDYKREKYK